MLIGTVLASEQTASAGDITSRFNVQAQTACETQMLGKVEAHELFSGKAYDVVTEVARAYHRPIPHVYTVPGSWNMAYIAGSIAVDGRGKILMGQQAIERFDTTALKGFLGHEMAHLVSDSAMEGCSDYILRDPQMEADADSLAVRMLGRRPVKAFLEQALALTEGQSWEVKVRLEMLRINRVSDSNDQTRVR
jgi:Zn-dependent protease with chaperone function